MVDESTDGTENFVAVTSEAETLAPSEQSDAPEDTSDDAEQETEQQDGGDAEDAGAKRDAKGRFKKRIDKLTHEKKAAERKAAELEKKLAQQSDNSEKPPDEQQNQTDEGPSPEDYDSYDDYLEALAEHKSGKASKAEEKESQQSAQESEEDPDFDDAVAVMSEHFTDAREKYSDFDEVALADDVPVTRDMMIAIADADEPGELAYYLGQNKAEAARIAELTTATAQARAIGKVEAQMAKGGPKGPRKKTTEAPDPIEPVSGNSPPTRDPANMSFEEFEAQRNQQAQARGFW